MFVITSYSIHYTKLYENAIYKVCVQDILATIQSIRIFCTTVILGVITSYSIHYTKLYDYAMSLAPITWVVISEIFPNNIRGAAVAVSTTALWAASFGLTYTFPVLNKFLSASGTFWLYSIICAFGFLFVLRKMPETSYNFV